MLESSVFFENPGGYADKGAVGGSGSDAAMVQWGCDESDRISAGSRWPQEETLALLKIRSEMDIVFRDSPLKAPLWDEVSRKLAELGYHRSAKKCKEKFENVFKYHKRTKDSRTNRQHAKTYRFFEQLELLDSQITTPLNQTSTQDLGLPFNGDVEFMSAFTSRESSSDEGSAKKRRRKVMDYFERLMKDVLEKQENLQNKFLEALEKCEKEWIAREEAWKVQEMARIKKEKELLAQERALAEAKDAAVLSFLQKLTQQTVPVQMPDILTTLFTKASENLEKLEENVAERHDNSAGESTIVMSSSRWPKEEVEALIMLKTDLDLKYHDNAPKGPLWEEISSSMKKLGHDRTAKRCKEKWENINKYYKRVKESKKRRPEDSKTCPYFNLLDSLYAKKSKGSSSKPEQISMQTIFQNPQASLGESDAQNQEDDGEDEQEGYQILNMEAASMEEA